MKRVGIVFVVVLFCGLVARAEHLSATVTVSVDDPDTEVLEQILETMPALLTDGGDVVEETAAEKLHRISANMLARYWRDKIRKLRRYQATQSIDEAVVSVD